MPRSSQLYSGSECVCNLSDTTQNELNWCTQWNVVEFRYYVGPDVMDAQTYIFVADGDTTIKDNTYTKILRYYSLLPENKEYVAAIRQQGDSVMVHYEHVDYLLYDFGVKIGDERDVFVGINNWEDLYQIDGRSTHKNKVTDVSILPDGRRKIAVEIYLLNPENNYEDYNGYVGWTEWIEGVGCRDGLLYTGACSGRSGCFSHALLCASKGEEYLYINDDEFFSQFNCVCNGTNLTAVQEVQADPTNAHKVIENGQLIIIRDDVRYNVLGALMK